MASDHFFPHRRFSHFIKDLPVTKITFCLSSPVDTKDKVERGRYITVRLVGAFEFGGNVYKVIKHEVDFVTT